MIQKSGGSLLLDTQQRRCRHWTRLRPLRVKDSVTSIYSNSSLSGMDVFSVQICSYANKKHSHSERSEESQCSKTEILRSPRRPQNDVEHVLIPDRRK